MSIYGTNNRITIFIKYSSAYLFIPANLRLDEPNDRAGIKEKLRRYRNIFRLNTLISF